MGCNRNDQYLPIQPLLDWLTTNVPVDDTHAMNGPARQDFARRCGVHTATMRRWTAAGRLAYWRADEVCIHMEVHPLEIWGDEWLRLLIQQDELLLAKLHEAQRGLRRVGEVIKTVVKIYGDSYRAFAAEHGLDNVRLGQMARGKVVPTNEEYATFMNLLRKAQHER
jgi:hypothetical protein